MTGALLGLVASAAMSASAVCCVAPAAPDMKHGGHHMPMPDHQQMPMGCHAVLGCAGSRKLRPGP